MISWKKHGRIFVPSGEGFFKSHATRPIPYRLSADVLRIFFSSRDAEDRMLPAYVDVDINDPSSVLHVCATAPVQLGAPGTFDDAGVTLASIVDRDDGAWVYYTGWKRRRSGVSFELSVGILHWNKKSDSFERLFTGPIMGQDRHHPYLVAGPFVLFDNGKYRMWYCSGHPWRFPEGNPEPIYTVHYAESADGIDWTARENPVIPFKYDGEVVSAPWVIKSAGVYRMWYSSRGHATREAKNYTIGYAESADGISWQRLDDLAGLSVSPSGWDSQMACYPGFYAGKERVYMFYSGNAVGREGVGYAVATAADFG
jgi:hypothetical protein